MRRQAVKVGESSVPFDPHRLAELVFGLDLMAADNFALLAVAAIEQHETRHMVALRDRVYATVPIDVIRSGPKRVDVSEQYDAEEYVPRVRRVRGKPMFY